MRDRAALKLAIDLLYVPWRVRLVRKQPLPEGVPLLLRVAAGDLAAEKAAVDMADRPLEVIRQAATFFIEQILLSPDADSYRVLGASPAATNGELRHNMALLMRWLHPDMACQGERSVFAARIATAWNNLKTPVRRATYDNERQRARKSGNREHERAGTRSEKPGTTACSANQKPRSRSGRSRRSFGASGELRTSGLQRVLAFLLGRPRY